VIAVHYRHPHSDDIDRARQWAREIAGK